MSSARKEKSYPRAPILEAAAEIRYARQNEAKIDKAGAAVRAQYEEFRKEQVVEGSIDFNARNASFREVSPRLSMASRDQTRGLVMTNESIVWNQLAPYEGWDAFYSIFEFQLPKILKALGQPEVNRVGLRYVNRIDYPMRDDLGYHEEYLAFRIASGEILDPSSGFQWAIRREFHDLGLTAIVQSATTAPELPGYAAVMFDIDVFTDVDVPRKSDDILATFCKMRNLKNDIFEAGITDQARGLFNEPRT